ncbi:MAG: Rne/Rng family ribonuclease [Singulisphaera sp.]|nr:Rne/Rng family ribonuclease [Singulisphaera sp.]
MSVKPRPSLHASRSPSGRGASWPSGRPSWSPSRPANGNARELERARTPEPESPRAKPHARAGEPGYVPRRERSRAPESPFDIDSPGLPASPWSDLAAEPEFEPEVEVEPGAEEGVAEPGKLEGPRRRRRRRGRRRERERPEREVAPAPSDEDLEPALEDEEGEEAEPDLDHEAPRRGDAEVEGVALLDEFDFGEEPLVEELEEAGQDELREEPAHAAVEEAIDPELEEEIRREIAEITELEREMGLRGPIEARPRRDDEREAEAGRGGSRAPRGRGLAKPPIQEIFRRGDEVLVQVIKESIGTKGPTLSTYISIPGRYLVLMPGLNRVGVSRKIADEAQRRKLREIMNELNPPKGLGFIVRTAGLERTKRELARDLAYLLRLWKVILRRIKKARAPAPIYQESDMITRTIRDIFTSEIDTIWIDEPSAFERAQEFLRNVMPRFVNRLRLYDEKVPLFHKYAIEDEIAKIQRRHVPLPEGGSIVIDQTEALVAIDVNSGNFRVENDAERTAYEMNLRAAKEIARQLRLRDLGGVIVNDFIDMRDERHRRGVEKALRDAIKRDRARTKVLRMSAFGLIEMTRQRIRPSLKRSVYEDCPHCSGAGVVKTVESMSIDVMRLLALASHRDDIRRVNIGASSAVASYLNNRKRREIARIESEANMTIHIRAEEQAPAEHLQIDCFDGNNGEVKLLPLPAANNRRAH